MQQIKKEVFISHHTDSSAETVRKIAAALEGAGISCWYAPRDVEASFAGSIIGAIRECRIFLLLLNEHSNLSAHVLNEIHFAFDRFKNHEDIILLPFRIGECTLSDDVCYYLGRFHVMDGSMPPEVQRIRELVERISLLLGREPERSVTVREPAAPRDDAERVEKTYRITGKIVYPDTRFIGRKTELEQIRTVLTGPENKMFLVGMGGIGKSELAKMYIKQFSELYDVVLWTSFDGTLQQTIANDSAFPIQGLSHSDYPEDSPRAYFERKLRILKEISDRRILIVVDNFDVTDDPDLEEFCGGSYSVLFTTRYHQSAGCFPELEIDGMDSEEELLALFRSEYTRALDAAGLELVKGILRQLNGHPLSIRLVASAMQSRRLSPEKMTNLLNAGISGMAKENMKAADLIFGRLKQVFRLSTLREEEQHVLMNLSLIPLRGITVELFFEWCGFDDFDVIDDLIQKSWVIHNPITDEVHLHPLVAELMAELLAVHPESCTRLVTSLSEACHVTIHTSWDRKLMLNDYAGSVYERLPQGHPGWMMALDAKARLIMDMGRYRESAELFRELYLHADSLEKKLEYCHKQSHALILCGEAAEGYAVAEAGCVLVKDMELDQMSRMEGYFYNELLRRLSEACRQLGRYAESVEYGKQTLTFCDRFYCSTPQLSRGWAEYHLGWGYFYTDQLEEAEQMIRHAISLFEEIDDIWSANYAYSALGQILAKRERYEEALQMSRRSYEILLNYYSEDHRDFAKNLEWRGNIYFDMGDTEKANACYRRAMEIYLKHNCVKMAERVELRIR